MEPRYIFTSRRLGFRNWTQDDLLNLAALTGDPVVMEHFPNILTFSEAEAFLARLQNHFKERGYTYFATEILDTGEWIGFTGLAYQDYESPFTPATDIGWRLMQSAWGKGFATEGARRCLAYAFETLKMTNLVATCTLSNLKSEKVMQKIGMSRQGAFNHPKLKAFPHLERCVWYEIKNG